MLRIYCDRNVYAILKESHPSFDVNLQRVMDDAKDRFILTYSDAHMRDLSKSSKEYLDTDLEFMEKYVQRNFFTHDHVTFKGTNSIRCVPKEAFDRFDFEEFSGENGILDAMAFDPEDPLESSLSGLMSSLFKMNVPINPKDLESDDEETEKLLRSMFPKDSEGNIDTTIGGLLQYGLKMQNDKRELAKIRNTVLKHNKTDYSFDKVGDKFNSEFEKSIFNQPFDKLVESTMQKDKRDKTKYQDFLAYYRALEMYRVTNEGNKNNFASLNTDGEHAWFGSYSDFLITDDKGLLEKAKLTYNHFNIPTMVMSISDFIEYYDNLLQKEDSDATELIKSIGDSIKNHEVIDQVLDDNDNISAIYGKLKTPLCNYFNEVEIVWKEDDQISYTFYVKRVSWSNWYLFKEIELMVNRLIELLGADAYGKKQFEWKEIEDENLNIRIWQIGTIVLGLFRTHTKHGNYISLQLEILPDKD